MFTILKDKYTSPRISGEFLDCSMPMTFDQYNNCGFNCLYCFSSFQRSQDFGDRKENYLIKKIKKVSIDKFKWYFTALGEPKNPFRNYIKNKITMQWGGLSDPFCSIEEQEHTGYEILKFLKEIKYPICFSSKSDLLLRDEKYFDLFRGMEKLWSYKASIITLDEQKSKIFEAGTPTPQRRLEVLKKLSSIGIWTILRLRPFIIGLTDKTYLDLIKEAIKCGIKAISTEFLCIEIRSINSSQNKWDLMSKEMGFDIIQYYKNISSTTGYLRLNYSIKKPYIDKMRDLCHDYNINFHVSDAHCKECGDSGSCCGLPNTGLTKFSKCQFTNAIHIASKQGFVTWDDIAKDDIFLKDLQFLDAQGLNRGGDYKQEKKCRVSLLIYMRNAWNNPKDLNSPYRYFDGVLYPAKLDKNKNIVYIFNPKKNENSYT